MAEKQQIRPLGEAASRANIPQNLVPFVAGQRQVIELQRTGFMLGLIAVCTINVTMPAAGAITALTWGPENFIKNIEVATNNGATFYRTSGLGNYFVQRMRKPMDYKSPVPTFNSTAVASSVYNYPATPANSATFNISFPVDIRSVLGEKELNSLLLLEGEQVITLAVTWGTAADLYTTANAMTINSVSLGFEADCMILPRGVDARLYAANVSPLVQVLEESRDLNGGPYRWYPKQRGAINRLAFWITTAAGVIRPTSFIGSYQLNFGNVSTPVRGTIQNKLAFDVGEQDGMYYPDGLHVFDFLMGNGDKRMPSMRDSIRVMDGDDVYFEFTFPVAPSAGDRINVITEMLKSAETI